MFNEYSKIFENDNLNKILFHGIDCLINKEEYLEMFLMFLPEKKTEQILAVIKEHFDKDKNKNKEIIALFENIFRKINLNTEDGFHFLKETILLFLQNKYNFINSFEEIKIKYIIENK